VARGQWNLPRPGSPILQQVVQGLPAWFYAAAAPMRFRQDQGVLWRLMLSSLPATFIWRNTTSYICSHR
jgi:hypothetical protein